MGADRETVLAYWRDHPHLSDRQINDVFGGAFNRNTLRTWKRTYLAPVASEPEKPPITGHIPQQMPLPTMPPRVERPPKPEELRDLGLTEDEVASEDMTAHAALAMGLTVELKDRLVRFLRAGAPQGVAARRVGIGEVTFYAWKKKGRADVNAGVESIHREFYEESERAVAEVETKLVRAMMALAKGGDFKAIKYMLESRFPARWRQHKIVEHQGNEPQPGATLVVQVQALALQLAAMTPEQLRALATEPEVVDVESEPG